MDAATSPTIQRLLERLPEFRGSFDEERASWGGADYGSYLALNDLARWVLGSADGALHERAFRAFEEVYADAALVDGRDLAIEFFESVCEAGRARFDRFIGPRSREWFDMHGW